MTHAELVAVAVRWLRGTRRCSVVFAEWAPLSVCEIPDAIGWDRGGHSTLVECKVSRSDFLRDRDKPSRRRGSASMGMRRWYLCPLGVLRPEDLPDGWGLAEVRGASVPRVYVLRDPAPRGDHDHRSELALLAAAVWRHQHGIAWYPDRSRFAPVYGS